MRGVQVSPPLMPRSIPCTRSSGAPCARRLCAECGGGLAVTGSRHSPLLRRPERAMMEAMNRASFFRIILVLVAINAAIGIFALVGGELGETGGKILGTSLLATMGAVLALVCAPAAGAARAWGWPKIGMLAAGSGAAPFIF